MGPRGCALVVLALLLGGAIAAIPPPSLAAPVVDTITAANWPIALAFSPDGRVFYAERNTGQIRIFASGSILPTPFYTIPDTATGGERGLLGLALDPGFPGVPWVYAYQTYNDAANGTVHNRIVRIAASGDVGTSMQVLLKMPALSSATNHNGGVIAFGPDGKLYAVVGENADPALAQDPLSPMGKVLRMNPDGSPPADNPFFGNPAWHPLVYSYGHRNMFGLAFHPDTNGVWVTENGPQCNDEVNLLVPGGNFAWGVSSTCASLPPPPQNTNQDGPLPREMPKYWWTPTICPTNVAIYRGPYFPGWHGDLFMGDCKTNRLHRLDLAGPSWDTVLSDTSVWAAPGPIIEVEEAPDGSIWFTTPTTIYRFRDANRPPTAAFLAVPQNTIPGVDVTFDASISADPDGTIVAYAWEFGDGSTGTGQIATHAYGAPGRYAVNLTVTDNEGLTDTATATVTIGAPPYATFTATPGAANPGEPIAFDASGSTDDGAIVSYAWDFGDGATGSGVQVVHAFVSSGTYDVVLTVTDDAGLRDTHTESVRVNAPPVARFLVDRTTSFVGVPFLFTSTATDPDGTIAAADWTFGDGATATGVTVSHAYASKGAFVVTLTVTDDMGLTAATARTVVVANRPPVITDGTPAGAPVVLPGARQEIAVTAEDPDGDALSYAWRVDGVLVSTRGPSFEFSAAQPGEYRVNVTVSDGALEDWREWTVTVPAAPCCDGQVYVLAGIGAFVVAVALALAFLLWRRRKRAAP